jgi:hypothetical protein
VFPPSPSTNEKVPALFPDRHGHRFFAQAQKMICCGQEEEEETGKTCNMEEEDA